MQYCPKCKVKVRGYKTECPLCQGRLTGTPEDYLNDLANQQTKRIMVLQAIANKEGIEVSQETIDKYIQEDYDNYFNSSYSTIDEFKASFDAEDYREQIMAEQVADFLVENANISE